MNFTDPKLTLFAFHLRNNFSQKEPVKDANFLWEQCQKLGEYLNIPQLKHFRDRLSTENDQIGVKLSNPKSSYLELLPSESLIRFSAIPDGNRLQIRGEIYPLQVHDTYAVDITLRFLNSQVRLAQLKELNPQNCLQFKQSDSSLGQVLIFFAKPNSKLEEYKDLANRCLISILPKIVSQQYTLSSEGQFLGSPIFEYKPINDSVDQFNSILIWFNCCSQTEVLEASGEYYQPLINLFCCSSKIDYINCLSRQSNQKARSQYIKLANELDNFQEQQLYQLKDLLLDLPNTSLEYANSLRDLELHKTTIEANLKNYQLWIEKFESITLNQDNIEFWQQQKIDLILLYIEQIKTDIAYIQPNQPLFQQGIDTIRGLVEIEQAEIDRNNENAAQNRQQRLEVVITLVSTGLAVSGISSSVANETVMTAFSQLSICPSTPQSELSQQSFCSFSLILFHLLLGIILAIPMGILVWSWQKNYVKKR